MEPSDLGSCGIVYFQVLTVMKPEGFLELSLLNNLGDSWENPNFAKFAPQRKYSKCFPHCVVVDVCSDNFQGPVDIITGTQPPFFSPSEWSFVLETTQARKTVWFFLWMDEVQGQESLLGIEIWTLNYNFTKHVFQTVIFGHFEREGTMGAQKRL